MRLVFASILFLMFFSLEGQSYRVYEGDTINVTDARKLKQGLWISFDNVGERITEKGTYLNNRKHGVWEAFYPSGAKKHEISYKKGAAIGPSRFFQENGKVSEEGYWNVDHWEGPYKFYHKSGKLAYDWNYNEKGTRSGEQKYYHENGALKYKGEWDSGKTVGSLKIFNQEGQLITERIYDDGKFADNVVHEPVKEEAPAKEISSFNGTGMSIVYNLQGKPERKGFFVRGKLFNGQYYQYDEKGELVSTQHYENGELKRTETAKKSQ
ncbi:toxin-antitoxin system YwqK family antitoxin [Carboxylicivirga sp. N1Y90]|uniref:toxin-antitoxin system YwqK family antitoxin n=1 Tax=Carboxylicivirga fragile TaxID=3417571 RepID=UPI003D33A202|nr:toxin-antitoxin system YwqK family antitoxin [Marinilabiliaceae bacterium N1Y90]